MKITSIILPALVLVLASCSGEGSTNKASVSIAQLSQEVNRTEYYRGQEYLMILKEKALDRSVPDAQGKARKLLKHMEDIDKLTIDRIIFLENLKIDLLKSLGEDLKSQGGPNDVVQQRPEMRDPLRPAQYALYNVKYTGTTDFLDFEGDNGKKIMEAITSFRNAVAEKVAASSSTDEKTYFFKAPAISDYADFNDLHNKVDRSLRQSAVSPDDYEMIKTVYIGLTFRTSHWRDLLAPDCPWEDAFQLLTTLQYKVLQARADALATIRSRVSGSEYSFDKILVMTPGPEYVKAGTEIDFEVLVGAFDSNRQPIITVNGAMLREVRDGKGIVSFGANKPGKVEITGTITIMNKSGIPKTLPWKKTITVGE